MAHYDIRLFTSEELYDYCDSEYNWGWRAAANALTYFEGAFDRENHTADVAASIEKKIPAPTEHYDRSFYDNPCGAYFKYYESLTSWFGHDYLPCSSLETAEVNILLTKTNNAGGGSLSRNTGAGVVQTGKYIADLPSTFEERGNTKAFSAMDTALHEFGHYAMGGVPGSHQRGRTKYKSDGDYITPMLDPGSDDFDGTNYCGVKSNTNDWGNEMEWAYCCTKEW